MTPTYCVLLWDHEIDGWSEELARDILDGPNTGLTWFHGIGAAIQKLRGMGWSNVSVYVSLEDV